MSISRRAFIKTTGIVTASAGVLGVGGILTGCGDNKTADAKSVSSATASASGEKSTVYFSKNIDAEHLIQLYKKINS